MKLTPAQIALVANALSLAAEQYERHAKDFAKTDSPPPGKEPNAFGEEFPQTARALAEQFRWQAETARELSDEMMIATNVTIV